MAVIWTRNMPNLALTLALLLLVVVASTRAQTNDGSSSTEDMAPIKAGLEPFYALTQDFLDLIRSADTWLGDVAAFDYLLDGDTTQFMEYTKNNWKEYTEYFLGFVICIAIGILFIFIMFFGGLCFCCCRCCGKCGANIEKNAGRRGKCKRVSCGVAMFVFTTILLAGVVLVFLSNEMIHKRITSEESFFQAAVDRVDQIETFRAETQRTFMDVVPSVEEFVHGIIVKLNALPQDSQTYIDDMFNATEILTAGAELAASATTIQGRLTQVQTMTDSLKTEGADLDQALTNVKQDLMNDLVNCPSSIQGDCQYIRPSVDTLDTVADFTMVYDIQNQLDEINGVIGSDLEGLLEEGEQMLDSISTEVNNSIYRHVQDAIREINDIVADIRTQVQSEVISQLEDNIPQELQKFKDDLTSSAEDVKLYGDYWRYGGITVGCILLIVVILYYFGLAMGCCGEPPYDGGSCNRGVGASLMLGGAIWTFLFSWIIMIVLILLFITGGMMHTEICRPLRTLGGTNLSREVLMEVSDVLREHGYTEGLERELDLTMYEFVMSCYNNDTVYTTLNIQRYYDVTVKLDLDTYNVQQFRDIPSSMQVQLSNVVIASTDAITQLENLRDSNLEGIDFATFTTELNRQIINEDLLRLATQLDSMADTARNQDAAFADRLVSHASSLRNIHNTMVNSIQELMVQLREVISSLEDVILNPPFNTVVQELIDSLLRAQGHIQNEGPGSLQQFVQDQVDTTYYQTKDFMDQLAYEIINELAPMGVVHRILNGFIQTDICYDTVTSINVFWFSLGWSLAFFIPCLILALCLNKEYRKEDYSAYGNSKSFDDPALGAVSIRKTVLPGMAIPMLKIRRPNGRLIFNMGIPIPGKDGLYIETGPRLIASQPSVALRQSYDCLSASETTEKNIDGNFDAYVGMMPGDNIPLEDYERRDTRPDGHQNRAYQRDNQYRNGAPAYPGGGEGGYGWNARHHGGVPPSGPPRSAPPNPPHYHKQDIHTPQFGGFWYRRGPRYGDNSESAPVALTSYSNRARVY